MKKFLMTFCVVMLLASLLVTPALAKTTVIKGSVTAVNADGTLTIVSNKGLTVTVTPPPGFDLSSVTVGASILVKGQTQKDGSFVVESIQLLGAGAPDADETEEPDDDDAGEDEAEGLKAENSAFCDPAKKGVPHPVALKLAQRYNVSAEWVMGYFCDGYGMGGIMLALKTSELTGQPADELLSQRAEGKGWGVIWKELKLIGNEKAVKTPPGLLKKADKAKK